MAYSLGTVIIVPKKRSLQPEGLHPPRGVAASGFRPLCKIPDCCLPQESGPCLSPSLGDRPLRPPNDRRLGEPLPHQRANRTQASPEAPHGFPRTNERTNTCGISHPFGQLFPTSGQVTYALLSRPPLGTRASPSPPFDLHVSCTPPAFILSQDQTLRQERISLAEGPS